jgi:hypothetical protein
VAGFLGAVNWIDGVGVRPEATRISRVTPPEGSRASPATIAGSVFLGNCFQVEARLPSGASVVAEVPRPDGDFHPGESVHVWWRAGDEMSFPQEPA